VSAETTANHELSRRHSGRIDAMAGLLLLLLLLLLGRRPSL